MMQLKIMALSFDYLSLLWEDFYLLQMLLRNFLLWRRQQLAFLWMRDIISQDCNRSETQMFTQWPKIGFCWYSDQIRPRDHPKIAWDLRSRGDFVPQLFVSSLPVSCLDLQSPRNSWFSCDPRVWTLDHKTYLSLISVLLPGHTQGPWRTFICLLFKSPHLKQFVPGISISNRDHRQSQQTPSGWPMTILSIAITISVPPPDQ